MSNRNRRHTALVKGPGDFLDDAILRITGEPPRLGGRKRERLRVMNRWGSDCRHHLPLIIRSLQTEASEKKWPVRSRHAAKTIVLNCIRQHESLKSRVTIHPPASHDWTAGIDHWPDFLNNTLPDCTLSAVVRLIQLWRWNTDHSRKYPTDEEIRAEFAGQFFDNFGASPPRVMRQWKEIGLFGHKIEDYYVINHRDRDSVKLAAWAAGGLYVELHANHEMITKAKKHKTWGPGDAGGVAAHACVLGGYTGDSVVYIPWGDPYGRELATWDFATVDTINAYAVLSKHYWIRGKKSPAGLTFQETKKLIQYL
jgi:hypothetical protein